MDWHKLNIKIPSGAKGNIKTTCPSCTPHNRKPENRNSKDLSVNIEEGIFNCHNCGWKGTAKEMPQKVYHKPIEIELPLSEKSVKWFSDRSIKENTLKFFSITEKMEYMPQESKEMKAIMFPYKRDGKWVNVKYRDAKKNFKLTKDAELILFNLDAIFDKKRAMITEGEIDAMSVHESGFFEVCSVPNGASKGNQRLEYIDNCFQAFSDCERIYIATDNDEAGIALKIELVRRLGRDRCYEVKYPIGCKDFNEVLVRHGMKDVWDCINNATPFPLEGILRLKDFENELNSIYEYGFKQGVKVGFNEFDELLNFSEGQLTIFSGVPNSGKSAYVDQLLLRIADLHQWNIGICSFENQPITRHAANLSQCHIGTTFYGYNKMNAEQFAEAKLFLNNFFFWLEIGETDLSIEGILDRGKMLVKTHGIKMLLIDPFNYIESKRPKDKTETEYISDILGKIALFSKRYGVHTILVAHPTKMKKNPVTNEYEVPTLYDISGSANFFNKCDNGVIVHRDRATDKVTVYVQKVRFFFNGKLGFSEFSYDVRTGRYTPMNEPLNLPSLPPPKPNAGFQSYNPNRMTEGAKIDLNEEIPF